MKQLKVTLDPELDYGSSSAQYRSHSVFHTGTVIEKLPQPDSGFLRFIVDDKEIAFRSNIVRSYEIGELKAVEVPVPARDYSTYPGYPEDIRKVRY